MAKRTWRWVTRDMGDSEVCVWRGLEKPRLDDFSWWYAEKSRPVDGASDIAYGHWLEVFGVPLKPGEIKKVRFTCEVL